MASNLSKNLPALNLKAKDAKNINNVVNQINNKLQNNIFQNINSPFKEIRTEPIEKNINKNKYFSEKINKGKSNSLIGSGGNELLNNLKLKSSLDATIRPKRINNKVNSMFR